MPSTKKSSAERTGKAHRHHPNRQIINAMSAASRHTWFLSVQGRSAHYTVIDAEFLMLTRVLRTSSVLFVILNRWRRFLGPHSRNLPRLSRRGNGKVIRSMFQSIFLLQVCLWMVHQTSVSPPEVQYYEYQQSTQKKHLRFKQQSDYFGRPPSSIKSITQKSVWCENFYAVVSYC